VVILGAELLVRQRDGGHHDRRTVERQIADEMGRHWNIDVLRRDVSDAQRDRPQACLRESERRQRVLARVEQHRNDRRHHEDGFCVERRDRLPVEQFFRDGWEKDGGQSERDERGPTVHAEHAHAIVDVREQG